MSDQEVAKVKSELSEIIKDGAVIAAVMVVVFLFAPGVLSLFIFHRDLFYTLDIFKILALSAAFNAPFVLLNFVLLALLDQKFVREQSKRKHDRAFFSLIFGTFASSLFFLFGISISTLSINTFKFSLIVTGILEIICAILIIIALIAKSKQTKKLNNE